MLFFFFFNDTATTEIYTLSLHDALPIFEIRVAAFVDGERVLLVTEKGRSTGERRVTRDQRAVAGKRSNERHEDRKSTRLNSSHANISYAVFCLKKKKNKQ